MKYVMRRISAAGLTGLLLLSLILTACGGAVESISEPEQAEADASTAVVDAVAEDSEVKEETKETEAEVVQATEEVPETETTLQQDAAETLVTCETVMIPNNELVAAPSEDDWSKGLATAAITVIEYGDFQ